MSAAASEAAVKALIFTMAGSHTQASKLSVISSLLMSTPYHLNPECRGGGGGGRRGRRGGGRERDRGNTDKRSTANN